MSSPFNINEIFEIADQIEVNGGRFYRRAAELFEDEEQKRILTGLAEMEDRHRMIFGEIRETLLDRKRQVPVYDPLDETVLYVRAFADGQVFIVDAEIGDFFEGDESLENIIHTAIGMEKDSIAFYVGFRDLVPEELGTDKIDRIIKEEKKHIIILTRELIALGRDR